MTEVDFNVGVDSEGDEDDEVLKNYQKTTSWQLQDIEKLKQQTNALLDANWKETRNKQLISKMLELEQPSITVKMVDFLLQESVCETLVGFITQNGHEGPRAGPNEQHGEAMKLAYRAVILLSPEVIPDPLNAILTKKAGIIAQRLFDIFLDDSAGSFYHVYRIMECLLRCYPAETFDGLRADGALSQRFSNMMKYVGFAPVCELVVMIIAFTPVVRNSQLCMASAKNRWLFLDDVNTWNLMFNITKAMVSPETFCVCNDHVTADQHSTAASQLLQDLIEKLSLEDTGDLLLLPLGQTSEIIDLLLETMTDSKIENGIRRSAARNVGFLLRRAAESEIVCFVATNNQSPPTPTYIPNRLFTLREKIVTFVRNRITDVIDSLLMFEETYTELVSPVKYSSYEVKRPFTVLRQLLIEVIVLTVESDESVAANIPLELWTNFIAWSLRYAHNNIYHALFYRLVFAVLRQGQETPQRILFQKAKFASFLVDNFVPYYNRGDNFICINEPLPKDTPNYDLAIRRIVARGLIMNCANAIRYQVSTEASSSFLYTFLSNHSKWSEFIAQLDTATDLQMNFGMGVQISIIESRGGGGNLMAEARPFEDTLDHNTRFAKSLGFFEDAPWSLETPFALSEDNNGTGDVEDTGRFSYLANDSDMSIAADLPPQPPTIS